MQHGPYLKANSASWLNYGSARAWESNWRRFVVGSLPTQNKTPAIHGQHCRNRNSPRLPTPPSCSANPTKFRGWQSLSAESAGRKTATNRYSGLILRRFPKSVTSTGLFGGSYSVAKKHISRLPIAAGSSSLFSADSLSLLSRP